MLNLLYLTFSWFSWISSFAKLVSFIIWQFCETAKLTKIIFYFPRTWKSFRNQFREIRNFVKNPTSIYVHFQQNNWQCSGRSLDGFIWACGTCRMLPVSLMAMGAEWGSSTSLEEASGRNPCRLPTTCILQLKGTVSRDSWWSTRGTVEHTPYARVSSLKISFEDILQLRSLEGPCSQNCVRSIGIRTYSTTRSESLLHATSYATNFYISCKTVKLRVI
jgi:hypothetical protein